MVNLLMQKSWFTPSTKTAYVGWSLIVLGTLLRLRQYFSGRSLWADEASLAYNLVHRDFLGLMRPLNYDQGAPVGFLFIEKLLITVLGNID